MPNREELLTQGRQLYLEEKYTQAANCAHEVLLLDKDDPEGHLLFGACCLDLGKFEHAIQHFKVAYKAFPKDHRVISNLSAAYRENNNIEIAYRLAAEAVKADPNDVNLLLNYGVTLIIMKEFEMAKHIFMRAVAVNYVDFHAKGDLCKLYPEHGVALRALGHLLLLLGEYEAGYRSVLEGENMQAANPPLPSMPWNGMNLGLQNLVVVLDQGYGDSIQFSRYIKRAARCARVIVMGPPEILELFRYVPGVSEVWSRTDQIPDHAAHCRISALPLLLGGCEDNVNPYFLTLPKYEGKPLPNNDKMRVGLVWKGRPVPRGRSIPFELLSDELRNLQDKVQFVSLQPNALQSELDMLPDMWVPDWLYTWLPTASLVQEMHCVVTIDSAMAHLAGTLGTNGLVMLNRSYDWRWDVEDVGGIDLYDTLNISRQRKMGDWSEVVKDAKIYITEMLEK